MFFVKRMSPYCSDNSLLRIVTRSDFLIKKRDSSSCIFYPFFIFNFEIYFVNVRFIVMLVIF